MKSKLELKIDRAYYAMKDRCYNSNYNKYHNYGGRGIKVCDEWLKDKSKFIQWSLQNGVALELSLDRIDTNGNYEPSNCRWVSMKTQQNNRRDNIKIKYKGNIYSIEELQNKLGIKYKTLYARIKHYNYNCKDIVEMPLGFKRNYVPKTGYNYIYKLKNKYSVQIHKKYYGITNSLEDAIILRDKILLKLERGDEE